MPQATLRLSTYEIMLTIRIGRCHGYDGRPNLPSRMYESIT